jgi:hypothetical protein
MAFIPYIQRLAEFAEFGERARIFAAAKYGSEAQYLEESERGERNYHLNGRQNNPEWNAAQGGGAPGVIIDPVSDH